MARRSFDSGPAVSTSDLSLGYPAHAGQRPFLAVEGVSVDLPRGGVLALLGESGSGKSTLARYLAGRGGDGDKQARIQQAGGEAVVLGAPIDRLSRRDRAGLTLRVGHLSQEAGARLAPELNVGDLLFEPLLERSKRIDREAFGEIIAEMMDLVALPLVKLQSFPYELSKGQRQRVAVVRSLMLEPALVIADEPTLGVDATHRPRIVDLLAWYRKRTGASMVLVSHDIGMLEALAERVVIMQQGRAVGRGDIDSIFRQSEHAYVRRLAEALRSTAYDEIAEE